MAYKTNGDTYIHYASGNLDFSSSMERIQEINKYYKQQQEEYKKIKFILDTLEAKRIDVIKQEVYYDFLLYGIEKAQKWLNMKDNCDKRKKYDEKDGYNTFIYCLSKQLFNNRNIEIECISFCGFEHYGWSIDVKLIDKNIIFNISIPVLKNINVENFNWASQGKLYVSYQSSPSCYSYVISDYDEENVAKGIEEFINNYKGGDDNDIK